MDHHMFDPQVSVLVDRYRLLFWDVRGHGQSRPLPRPFTSIDPAVADLEALLDTVGYEQAILVGHSMGGYISQEFLFYYPERVRALVNIGSTCVTMQHPAPAALAMRLSSEMFRLLPYSFMKWWAAHVVHVTPAVRDYTYQVLARHSKQEFLAIWDAAMKAVHPEPGYRIFQPVLVTYGRKDWVGFGTVSRQTRAWARRDPNCHRVAIPKAGHNAQQENPGYFNKVLIDFLDQHELANEG
jgi:pimeloyl-ACP methyl ester carboxylesterase